MKEFCVDSNLEVLTVKLTLDFCCHAPQSKDLQGLSEFKVNLVTVTSLVVLPSLLSRLRWSWFPRRTLSWIFSSYQASYSFFYFFPTTVQFLSESLVWLKDVFPSLVRSCSSCTIFAVLCRLVSLLRGIQFSRCFCLHTVADETSRFGNIRKKFVDLHSFLTCISAISTTVTVFHHPLYITGNDFAFCQGFFLTISKSLYRCINCKVWFCMFCQLTRLFFYPLLLLATILQKYIFFLFDFFNFVCLHKIGMDYL